MTGFHSSKFALNSRASWQVQGSSEGLQVCTQFQVSIQDIIIGTTAHNMIQSTHYDLFSDALGFFIDKTFCAPKMMNDQEQCDDDNSAVWEDRTQSPSFHFDSPAKHHSMCERQDDSCSIRESSRPPSPPLSPTKYYGGTHVTAPAALTSESSFDINDAFSTKMNYYESNSIFRSHKSSGINSIFRPTQDYDFDRRKRYGNLVRMKQANYQLEEPAPPRPSHSLSRRVLTDTIEA
jgi:hypothetical protein